MEVDISVEQFIASMPDIIFHEFASLLLFVHVCYGIEQFTC
jgi:hypothetical protein